MSAPMLTIQAERYQRAWSTTCYRRCGARVKLADALDLEADDIVSLVGGGETSAMFRLAREMVQSGGRAITKAQAT